MSSLTGVCCLAKAGRLKSANFLIPVNRCHSTGYYLSVDLILQYQLYMQFLIFLSVNCIYSIHQYIQRLYPSFGRCLLLNRADGLNITQQAATTLYIASYLSLQILFDAKWRGNTLSKISIKCLAAFHKLASELQYIKSLVSYFSLHLAAQNEAHCQGLNYLMHL